ncbi:hypothetical protein [Lacisediminihabitans changchengi]|uniref:Uncharacterized protein n=1 Tax=Lacisediminihabitans changchengi TaxID=2787634 RepID=A0A934SSR6_9MICO|nr:hypothetical protein [Lacisediminihabitans changchengi]MBK4348260.1 hypothetical protein [Lacisediminihabitans changchengi]
MTTNWLPAETDLSRFATLVDGIPQWMRPSLDAWYKDVLKPGHGEMMTWPTPMIVQYDARMQRTIPLSGSFSPYEPSTIRALLTEKEELDFIDFVVATIAEKFGSGTHHLTSLEALLVSGNSAWSVGTREGLAGLERRVPIGVQEAAEHVIDTPGHAGDLLSQAWHAVFGLEPDYEKGYAKSIKAVEAVAIPLVSPNHKLASLGTVVGQMRADGDWSLALVREHPTQTSASVVLGTAQALWTGQNDRHAGQSDYVPTTRRDAEAAVMMAVSLVQWFASGLVARSA